MPKQTRLDESANIYQHKEIMSEKDKLRDMSTKEKFHYLWEYYRYQGLLILLSISLIIYIIYKIVTPNVETRFYAAFVNNTINPDLLEDYQQDFHGHLKLDPELEEVFFNNTFYLGSPTEYSMTMRQALYTYVAAKEIDVIIAPEDEFIQMTHNALFEDLSDQLPTDLYSSLTNHFYISSNSEDPVERVYGIYLTETDLYKNNTNTTTPYIIGIVANSNYKENSVEFIRYLFNIFP